MLSLSSPDLSLPEHVKKARALLAADFKHNWPLVVEKGKNEIYKLLCICYAVAKNKLTEDEAKRYKAEIPELFTFISHEDNQACRKTYHTAMGEIIADTQACIIFDDCMQQLGLKKPFQDKIKSYDQSSKQDESNKDLKIQYAFDLLYAIVIQNKIDKLVSTDIVTGVPSQQIDDIQDEEVRRQLWHRLTSKLTKLISIKPILQPGQVDLNDILKGKKSLLERGEVQHQDYNPHRVDHLVDIATQSSAGQDSREVQATTTTMENAAQVELNAAETGVQTDNEVVGESKEAQTTLDTHQDKALLAVPLQADQEMQTDEDQNDLVVELQTQIQQLQEQQAASLQTTSAQMQHSEDISIKDAGMQCDIDITDIKNLQEKMALLNAIILILEKFIAQSDKKPERADVTSELITILKSNIIAIVKHLQTVMAQSQLLTASDPERMQQMAELRAKLEQLVINLQGLQESFDLDAPSESNWLEILAQLQAFLGAWLGPVKLVSDKQPETTAEIKTRQQQIQTEVLVDVPDLTQRMQGQQDQIAALTKIVQQLQIDITNIATQLANKTTQDQESFAVILQQQLQFELTKVTQQLKSLPQDALAQIKIQLDSVGQQHDQRLDALQQEYDALKTQIEELFKLLQDLSTWKQQTTEQLVAVTAQLKLLAELPSRLSELTSAFEQFKQQLVVETDKKLERHKTEMTALVAGQGNDSEDRIKQAVTEQAQALQKTILEKYNQLVINLQLTRQENQDEIKGLRQQLVDQQTAAATKDAQLLQYQLQLAELIKLAQTVSAQPDNTHAMQEILQQMRQQQALLEQLIKEARQAVEEQKLLVAQEQLIPESDEEEPVSQVSVLKVRKSLVDQRRLTPELANVMTRRNEISTDSMHKAEEDHEPRVLTVRKLPVVQERLTPDFASTVAKYDNVHKAGVHTADKEPGFLELNVRHRLQSDTSNKVLSLFVKKAPAAVDAEQQKSAQKISNAVQEQEPTSEKGVQAELLPMPMTDTKKDAQEEQKIDAVDQGERTSVETHTDGGDQTGPVKPITTQDQSRVEPAKPLIAEGYQNKVAAPAVSPTKNTAIKHTTLAFPTTNSVAQHFDCEADVADITKYIDRCKQPFIEASNKLSSSLGGLAKYQALEAKCRFTIPTPGMLLNDYLTQTQINTASLEERDIATWYFCMHVVGAVHCADVYEADKQAAIINRLRSEGDWQHKLFQKNGDTTPSVRPSDVKVDFENATPGKRLVFDKTSGINTAEIYYAIDQLGYTDRINWNNVTEPADKKLIANICLSRWKKVSFDGQEVDRLSLLMPKEIGNWVKWLEAIKQDKDKQQLIERLINEVVLTSQDNIALEEFCFAASAQNLQQICPEAWQALQGKLGADKFAALKTKAPGSARLNVADRMLEKKPEPPQEGVAPQLLRPVK